MNENDPTYAFARFIAFLVIFKVAMYLMINGLSRAIRNHSN